MCAVKGSGRQYLLCVLHADEGIGRQYLLLVSGVVEGSDQQYLLYVSCFDEGGGRQFLLYVSYIPSGCSYNGKCDKQLRLWNSLNGFRHGSRWSDGSQTCQVNFRLCIILHCFILYGLIDTVDLGVMLCWLGDKWSWCMMIETDGTRQTGRPRKTSWGWWNVTDGTSKEDLVRLTELDRRDVRGRPRETDGTRQRGRPKKTSWDWWN